MGRKALVVSWLAAVPRKTPTMPTSEKTERYLMICCCDRLDLRKATSSAIDSAGWCSAIDVARSAACFVFSSQSTNQVSGSLSVEGLSEVREYLGIG